MTHPKQRFNTCYYMSSTSNIKPQYLECFGYIISIQTAPRYKLMEKYPWCLDNDEFQKKFKMRTWIKRLRDCQKYKDNCLFVVARDVVGDCEVTIKQFPRYAKIIRKFGYPVAFVTQDGLTPKRTPWDDFEVLFVGGTDKHKLGKEAGLLINEAIKRGKWVHIGRVNSPSRMRKFWRADSWDGTQLSFQPDNYTPAIAQAVMEIRAMQQSKTLWEAIQ